MACLPHLAIALLTAAFTDLKSRRIANWLNAAIALGAPLFWWASGMALWPDVAMQFGLRWRPSRCFRCCSPSADGRRAT